jgi:membrane protein implicated in regulation of membrane protease activity
MLVVSAVLVGLGSVLGLAGFAVSAAAAVGAFRRWYRRADLPPAELARLKWEQAKAAAGAGRGAWQEAELAKYSPRSERAMR